MSKHYVGEAGTLIILDTGVLVGSANFKYIKFKKADGVTTGTWSASAYDTFSSIAQSNGTYWLSHTLLASDLDQPGEWELQAFIGAVDGTWMGETVRFNVSDAFE